MATFRVEINRAGVAGLLRDKGVADDLAARGRRIATRAGDGFESSVWQGRDRVRATIRTATPAARRAEAENRALSRALAAGR